VFLFYPVMKRLRACLSTLARELVDEGEDVHHVGSTEAKYSSTELIFGELISFRFSKQVVERHGLSTSKIPKEPLEEGRQIEQRERNLESLQTEL
jgi:hypothetical protein